MSVSSAVLSRRFLSRSSACDLADAVMVVGRVGCGRRSEDATSLIHCFPGGLLCFFDSFCFASFNKVFVAGFSITCQVRFPDVDVGSTIPIICGQFGVDGDEDGQMIAVSDMETNQSDSSALSLEAKLMSGEVDRSFIDSLVASFCLRMV